MTSVDELSTLFAQVGFEEPKVKEILKNAKVSSSLESAIKLASSDFPWNKNTRALIHTLASSLKGAEVPHLDYIVNGIQKGELKTALQIDAALKYLKSKGADATVEEMNQESGVGIEVSEEQVRTRVAKYLDDNKDSILKERYKAVPGLFAKIKALPELKWAEPRLFKPIIDEEVLKVLGPKDERDLVKKEKKPKGDKKGNQKEDKKKEEAEGPKRSMFTEGFLGDLHKVGENPQAYPELMAEHLKATGGKVHTRFPPEPNGYLHIGHSKAIMVNFGYAKYHNGVCYLRFDDTNPETEAPEYFESIKNMVAWLGFKPWKITYSSDYFDKLYELAETLIKNGKAYVCHCTAEEIKRGRGIKEDGTPGGERKACVSRDRPIEESLTEFRKMRDGFYKPGEAILRMKQDLNSPSPQMWDLIAYRVLDAPHPRTGTKWRIYPTYDFTHCLVDSLENITHSLCTTEFYLSRESYEWLCDQVHVFRPAQREYGRLNITGTVLSKRKIAKLVNGGYVSGWNDPRLFTLEAIRRRGVPPGAILSFINTLGVTTSTTNIQVVRFESAIRKYLEDTTPRLMFILDPVEVVVDNVDEDFEVECTIPYRPNTPEFGDRMVPFKKRFYIERSDFSEDSENKEFFRLTPSQPVGLIKVPYTVSFQSLEKDADGKITRIHVKYDNEDAKPKKPKTYIQWVPISEKHNSPVRVAETRVYNQLFKSENPSAHPDGYLADINPDSVVVYKNSVSEYNINNVIKNSPWVVNNAKQSEFYVEEEKGRKEVCRFQAMRVGYFTLDSDSTDDKLILNRIVSLKEGTK
ncbi:glutaminyl-tRNA synthetase [Kluyveromyces marxianus DMKU3-1042]|uniref:glutamine--tRNA ligase n=1 Tax=Kluyveromyces marxianus (strain DMKU3-1042 / BCC 29191 / NBRC 104275) TaxID=1003335 RepID=W0T9W1_KLUMD|nr:glutaminyl-tRNA synthetase [Kluyveromyces marxianus DMKU3-1042]BAO40215.1 glutaminyl-tRNA synthetase [Kluyveromyces marxianus DMKU3-1042]